MTERRPATDDEARALASSLRLRILRICLSEAHTNKEIAAVLGRNPASTLHHVRTLVRTGFLVQQEEQRGARGAREIPYLATRKSWGLSTPPADQAMVAAFFEEVAQVPPAEVDAARLGLRLSPDDLEEFRDRIATVFDEFAARPDDPSAPAWSVFYALHPDPNRPASPAHEDAAGP